MGPDTPNHKILRCAQNDKEPWRAVHTLPIPEGRADDDSEVLEWRARDPIEAFEARLAETGALSAEEAAAVREAVRAETAEAIAFAEASEYPTEDALLADVYA